MSDILDKIKYWFKYRYVRVVNSIAFYPAFIALVFLIISIAVILFDFSETGKNLKSQLHWLSLKDAETARNIIVVIAGGILSLTVFSFSMVMIVLNQAASNMSNRVLNKLIGNRFQQVVLGVYIGTIVFALFLLSTIRDIDSGIYIPAISTYLLIITAIVDIFIFIYFLHYITQSVKYEVIIQRIYEKTQEVLKNTCTLKNEPKTFLPFEGNFNVRTNVSGVYQGFDKKGLLKLCTENNCILEIICNPGTFVLRGTIIIKSNAALTADVIENITGTLNISTDEAIENNFLYGFKQLTEIALKALSPGVNDPGTAVLSLRSLFRLLNYRIVLHPENTVMNDKRETSIFINTVDFDTIFESAILPIWDYGNNDRIIQNEMVGLLSQFQDKHSGEVVTALFEAVQKKQSERKPG